LDATYTLFGHISAALFYALVTQSRCCPLDMMAMVLDYDDGDVQEVAVPNATRI
jgi:hypothetical protein